MRPLVIAALLAAARASAQEQSSTIAAPHAAEPAARTNEGRGSALGVVVELRHDLGFRELLEVEYTNGRRITVSANEGTTVALGLSFLPLAGGRFATRASAGFKIDAVRAGNGRAIFTAIPLDVLEVAYVGPLRLGAGLSLLLAPRLSGTGFLEDASARMGPSPGAVAEAEWIFAPRARAGVGVRAAWHRMSMNGVTMGASTIGLALRADFDLAGPSR
jgi:hypothetical protein